MMRREVIRGILGGAIAGRSAGRAAVSAALEGVPRSGVASGAVGVGAQHQGVTTWRLRQMIERYRRAALEVHTASADPAIMSKRSWSPVYKAHVQAEQNEEMERLEQRLAEDPDVLAAVARALGVS